MAEIPAAAGSRRPAAPAALARAAESCGMLFCPFDGSLLTVDDSGGSSLRFLCRNCAYAMPVRQPLSRKMQLKAKKVDDILGGADAWKNVDQTDAVCPSCPNRRAYYMQFQTRSADEPMTVFYKCTACGCRWKE